MKLFDDLCNLIIRPSRHKYRLSQLGHRTTQNLQHHETHRTDFQILIKNAPIQCSLYKPTTSTSSPVSKICLVYLHSNSGSRIEGGSIKDLLVNQGIPVCLFDFRGSGLSAGDYVTYGWREKEDVGAVLEYLGNEFGYEGFVLWGRSMGAATALMYSRNPGRHRILLTIADSSYYDLKQLLLEIGNTQMNIPMFLLRPFLYMVQNCVQNRAGFKLSDITLKPNPNPNSPNHNHKPTPIIFVACKQDSIIPITHTQQLYKQYTGVKQLLYIQQDHQHGRKESDLRYLCGLVQRAVNRAKVEVVGTRLSVLLPRRETGRENGREHGREHGQMAESMNLNRCNSVESVEEEEVTMPLSSRSHKLSLVGSRRRAWAG